MLMACKQLYVLFDAVKGYISTTIRFMGRPIATQHGALQNENRVTYVFICLQTPKLLVLQKKTYENKGGLEIP